MLNHNETENETPWDNGIQTEATRERAIRVCAEMLKTEEFASAAFILEIL